MAKGAFNGVLRGKMGNTVFYKIKNSNDKEKQGLRPYVAKVSNPKTEAQATQRMKMTAATNFYRMMSQVLNNAYQSEKYGTRSRDKFMSLAMQATTGVPFIDKGDNKFYPGAYQISAGSLTEVSVTGIVGSGNSLIQTSLNLVSGSVSNSTTVGQLSQWLINDNFGLLNNDRLTFIGMFQNEQGTYSPVYTYFVLNTDDESTTVLSLGNTINLLLTDNVQSHKMQVEFTGIGSGNTCVGGAVIVSRAPSSVSAAWLRSNANVFITDAYKDVMMSTDRFNAALETYSKSTEVLSSDWYLNLGIYTNPNGSAMSGSLSITGVINASFSYNGSTQQVAIISLSDGTKRAGRYEGKVVKVNGSAYQQTSVEASTAVLNVIKGVDSDVTNWYNVPTATTSGGGDDIERP